MNSGDRVKIKMSDRYGNPLYGTIINPDFLGIAVLVSCDTQVDKRYCYTDDLEVMFMRDNIELLP